jgi:hypothetical protein
MSLVRGDNVLVEDFDSDSGEWVAYGCARSCTLNIKTDFLETTIRGSGKFATFRPTKNSFTGSVEGLVNLDNPAVLSLQDLRTKQIDQTKLRLRFKRTDETGNIYSSEADFYISSSEDNGPFDNLNSFSIELQGTGPIT